jgi:hypothetical protein
MLATVNSGAVVGLDATAVTVEVDYNPRAMTSFTKIDTLTTPQRMSIIAPSCTTKR